MVMQSVSSQVRLQQLTSYSRLAAFAVIAIGAAVLLGWHFDVVVLKSVLPDWASMKANTAGLLIFSGVGLWLSTSRASLIRSFIKQLSAFLVVLVGGLTLFEYIAQVNLSIDELVLFGSMSSDSSLYPGRMAPGTAMCFVLSGLALLLVEGKSLLSTTLALLSLVVALVALIGYFFSVSGLYTLGIYSSMAVHTAVALLLLNFGVLASQRRSPLVGLLVSNTAGGDSARSMVITVPSVVVGIGGAVMVGEGMEYFDSRCSLALMVTFNIVVLSAVMLRTARHLDQVDISREKSQSELAELNCALETRVIERTQEFEAANRKLTAEIARRQKVEDEARRLSLTDDLTGLHNRRSFFLLAEQQLRAARRNGLPCMLFFADVDGLKAINDIYGHEAGDLVITAAARALKAAFRESDVVARIGGDEFVALAVDVGEPANVIHDRLQAKVDEFNNSDLCRYPLALSIGAVNCEPRELKPLSELLATADALMYANKQSRRKAEAKAAQS